MCSLFVLLCKEARSVREISAVGFGVYGQTDFGNCGVLVIKSRVFSCMHPAFQSIEHRPWPLPKSKWIWRQSWLDLAFVHYRIDAKQIKHRLPDGLKLQEFDGTAWVGLVPFRMAGVMRRPFPDLPPFTTFPELNLRTYVEKDGKPGVWFFSLDADCRPLVWGGRMLYHLPYFYARMSHCWADGWHQFQSRRPNDTARFKARYRPTGESLRVTIGSFEHWATERYCLYSHSAGHGLSRVDVHHVPWPLQRGEIEIEANEILTAAGLTPLPESPRCHYSSGVHVVSYRPEMMTEPFGAVAVDGTLEVAHSRTAHSS